MRTINVAAAVYGDELDSADPAELLHEASKLHPSLLQRQMRGVARLEHNPALIASTSRAVRRNPALPRLRLPPARLTETPLREVLRTRRSTRRFHERSITVEQLATLLGSAYGVVRSGDGRPPFRTSPSAGALYPLELFVLAQRVDGLTKGALHYDPLAHELEQLPRQTREVDLSPLVEEFETAAAIVVVAAVFWRCRLKYGLRAYRFTLLEAGHVSQNLVLAATALGLGSIVLGGFYDARIDDLLGLDGVDESSLIAVSLGWPPASGR